MSIPASISLASSTSGGDFTQSSASDELDLLVHRFARQLHRRLAWKRRATIALIAFCICAVFTAGHYDHNLASFLRGEIDLFGETRYQPDHLTDPAALARIDFDRVHRELLPDWFGYAGRARMYTSREEADAAFAALRQAVQPDQNLSEIVAELNLLLATRQYLRSTHRLHYLLWAWNDYLRRNGVPYWVQGRAHNARYNAFFSVKTYDLLAQPGIKVGERGFNVGLVMRADNPLLSEPYLGAASRSARGAFVVVDRIQDLVVSEIWPLLGAPPDAAMDSGQRAFAEAVSAEVREQLPAWAVEILVRSAEHRWALSAAVDSLNARAACTGTQIAGVVPWDGVAPAEHARLLELANLWQGRRCPAIKPEEAEVLVDASWALQREVGLPEALGALVAWLSRAVTLHEARHLADSMRSEGRVVSVACPGCPEQMRPMVRAEISAYLATFAWSETPATALYQACRSVDREFDAHSAALRFILDQLMLRCDQPPPAELPELARGLERALFAREERLALRSDFPEHIRLP